MSAIDPGTLAQWLTLVGILAAGYIFLRGGGGAALGQLETANRVLEKRVVDLEQQAKKDQATIGELRGRTDVSIIMQAITVELVKHETNAEARSVRSLERLDRLIAALAAAHLTDPPSQA